MKNIFTILAVFFLLPVMLTGQVQQDRASAQDLAQKSGKDLSFALEFDNTDDYVGITNGTAMIAGLDSFSMCGWVYPTNPNTSWPDLDGFFGIKDEGICDFYIVHYGGGIEARITTDMGTYTITTSMTSDVILDEWHHYALVYTGAELQLYVDGTLDASVDASGTIIYDTKELTLGKLEFSSNDFYLDGKLDEVTIWSKALTDVEIQDIMCISGDPADMDGLTAYYDFNEGSGLALSDYFGNYDGLLYGMDGTEWVESEVCGSGYTITFTVTDEVTSLPIEGAEVDLDGWSKTTDANGQVEFPFSGPGTYSWTASMEDYYDASGEVEVIDQDVEVDVTLAPLVYYSVTFIVTDPDANPIENAIVNLDGLLHYTDETGTTVFTSYLPGSYNYTITKTNFVMLSGVAEVVDEDLIVEETLQPVPTYSITFVVTEDPGATPVEGAAVDVDGVVQYTDGTGSTVFGGYLPGTYGYSISKENYITQDGEAEVVDQDVEVAVTLEGVPTYSITFVVTEDPGATPVEGASVDVEGVVQYTDGTGTTVFEGYLPGSYNYTVSKTDYSEITGEAVVVDEDLTLDITLVISGISTFDEETFKVYPNPTGETIFIDYPGNGNELSIKVLTLDGKCLINKQAIGKNQPVSLKGLKEGVYFLEINLDGTRIMKKLVIE